MSTCHILIGIPGAGKSTWIKNNIPSSRVIISPDNYLEQQYNYEWTPERASEAWADSYEVFAANLKRGSSIVWDATFLREIDRSAVLHIANGFGYYTIAVVVQAPLGVCLERNRSRLRKPVPDQKVIAMNNLLNIPNEQEGFSEIILFDSV